MDLFFVFALFGLGASVIVITLTLIVVSLLKTIRDLETKNEGLQPPF